MPSKNRFWMVTVNNYVADDCWKPKKMNYLAMAKQVAPTTGTPHLQMYVQFINEMQLTSVRSMFKNACKHEADCQQARGTNVQARAYIMDDEKKTNVEPAREWGVMIEHEGCKKRKGERSDIKNFQEAVLEGKSRKHLIMEYPAQMTRMPTLYLEMKRIAEEKDYKDPVWPIAMPWGPLNKPDPAIKKRHIWLWGPPDLGKTMKIQDLLEGLNCVFMPSKGEYRFEDRSGYEDQDIIIYDDIRPSREEIIDVSNTWKLRKHVWGKSRNTPTFWKRNHTRTMIVISNDCPHLSDAEAARFTVIDASTIF